VGRVVLGGTVPLRFLAAVRALPAAKPASSVSAVRDLFVESFAAQR